MNDIDMKDFTPKRMVETFDRYVYGQLDAKAILAVAMRNRWRLCRLAHDVRLSVVKQNILLSGPTGSGKTALLRVLKNHFGLPVLEIDITGYTETGYVGKEVGTIINDLFSLEIPVPDWYKKEWAEREVRDKMEEAEKVKASPAKIEEPAEPQEVPSPFLGFYVKMLLALIRVKLFPNETSGLNQDQRREVITEAVGMLMVEDQSNRAESMTLLNAENRKKISKTGHNIICNRGANGVLTSNITSGGREPYVACRGWMPRFEVPESAPNMSDVFEDLHQQMKKETTDNKKARVLMKAAAVSSRIYELRGESAFGTTWNNPGGIAGGLNFLSEDLRQRLMNNPSLAAAFGNLNGAMNNRASDDVWRERFIQDYGVVFVDEIDKLAESNDSSGKDRVSRTGVQRSLLKALEGEDGHKHNTLNVLWIAAGSFANQPISRLMPELQGRLPLRAVIKPLDKEAYVQILKLPTSVFFSSIELLMVEEVKVLYDDATFEVLAEACEIVNQGQANLGARRLGDLVSELFRPAMYDASSYLEHGYDIRGEKAKWVIDVARQAVKAYKDSLADFASKETQGH
jgi:ATP-dependent protease HslVU (ClpYQ) ATPase subunit